MVQCRDCVHYRAFPGGTTWKRKTGCYHPEHMVQKQADAFLREQEVPGNHEVINLRSDCAQFEARPSQPSFFERVARAMRA